MSIRARRVLATVASTVATTLIVAATPADAANIAHAPRRMPVTSTLAAAPSPFPAPSPTPTPVPAAPAPAPHLDGAGPSTTVCEKYGSAPVADGRYVVQNDLWGADDEQCVRAFDTGFEVTVGAHHNTAQPAGYPSIFTGCHYGTCTAGTLLPRAVSDLGPLTSSWSYTTPERGRYTAAYDIWFDPTARRDGTVTGTEMMIWLRTEGPSPIGDKVATVGIAGAEWDVWRGENGAQVISYVRRTPTDQVSALDLTAFMADATGRGVLPPAWFLTSVQAGFEPWTGGAGLTTTDFAVDGVSASAPAPAPAS